MAKTKTKTVTMTNTFREHLQRAILETCDLWDIWSEWWGDMTTSDNFDNFWQSWQFWQLWQFLTTLTISDNFGNLRLVTFEWLQFWQLGTWIHDILCYLTIKSDTGQHSQFLRRLFGSELPLLGIDNYSSKWEHVRDGIESQVHFHIELQRHLSAVNSTYSHK